MTITSKSNRSPLVLALAAASLAGALSACAPLVVGGVAVGALVAVDRRSSGVQLDDEGIELRAASRLRDVIDSRSHINITSYNRQVLLTGEAPTQQAKQAIEQVVSGVENVRGIVNEIAVMPATTLTQRSADALITGKVRASIVDDRELYVGAYKVVTERGVVYLMGRVTQREADRATQVARSISGVARVVRIFDIIDEEELRRIGTGARAAPSQPAAPRGPAPVSSQTPTPVAPAAATVAPPAAEPPPPATTGATTSPTSGSSVAPQSLPPLTPGR
jgi:osmotically-inducible protein OsmY